MTWQPFIPARAVSDCAAPTTADISHYAAIAQKTQADITAANIAATKERQRKEGNAKGGRVKPSLETRRRMSAARILYGIRKRQEREEKAKAESAAIVEQAKADQEAAAKAKRDREAKYAVFIPRFDTPVSADDTPD